MWKIKRDFIRAFYLKVNLKNQGNAWDASLGGNSRNIVNSYTCALALSLIFGIIICKACT